MMALRRIAALAEIREIACLHVAARILFLILLHFSAKPHLVVIYPGILQYKICISKGDGSPHVTYSHRLQGDLVKLLVTEGPIPLGIS